MSKKVNVISNVVTMALTIVAVLCVVMICNSQYNAEFIEVLLFFLVGALSFGLLNAFVHEFGHIIVGQKNGFRFVSVTVWFFKWRRVNKHIRFDFVMMGEEAGSSEMITDYTDNIATRFKNMTLGGIGASAIMTVIGIVPLFLYSVLPLWAFCVLGMMLPVSVYYFVGNALPMSSEGVLNDGATVYGIKKNTPSAQVMTCILAFQARLTAGDTPSEVDEKFLFEVPQLPEDDLNFILLLNARYSFYLDKGDYANAKSTSDRLMTLLDYMPKTYRAVIKTDALYNACTFDYNEETADELMYEVEKYVNNVNDATNVRVKLAYLMYVAKNKDACEIFYEKGMRECKRNPVKGLAKMEEKLFNELKENF